MDEHTPNLFGQDDAPPVPPPLPCGEWPAQARDVAISFATSESVIGHILLAMTERGVCFLGIDDQRDNLILALLREYPGAAFQESHSLAGPLLRRIVRKLAAGKPCPAMPIDAPGTVWQRQVWAVLCDIPFGDTRTYGHIASYLGNPKRARAVGTACATNPVSILIPCHRAIAGDGSLQGYRWGIERKRSLLLIESGLSK